MNYEEAIKKLETILAQLKSGQMPLSELTAKIKEAEELVEFCKKALTETVDEVESMFNK